MHVQHREAFVNLDFGYGKILIDTLVSKDIVIKFTSGAAIIMTQAEFDKLYDAMQRKNDEDKNKEDL